MIAVSNGGSAIWQGLFLVLTRSRIWDVHEVRNHRLGSQVKATSWIFLLGVLWNQTLIKGVQLGIRRTLDSFVSYRTVCCLFNWRDQSLVLPILALLLKERRSAHLFDDLATASRTFNFDWVEKGW